MNQCFNRQSSEHSLSCHFFLILHSSHLRSRDLEDGLLSSRCSFCVTSPRGKQLPHLFAREVVRLVTLEEKGEKYDNSAKVHTIQFEFTPRHLPKNALLTASNERRKAGAFHPTPFGEMLLTWNNQGEGWKQSILFYIFFSNYQQLSQKYEYAPDTESINHKSFVSAVSSMTSRGKS